MSEGYIYTRCACCNKLNRIKVVFPSEFKGFETTTYQCINCNAFNVCKDEHTYDSDGHIC